MGNYMKDGLVSSTNKLQRGEGKRDGWEGAVY